ncbi:MAG: hypothetical protein ABI045_07440 [Flavobacteriales bacterium]
MEKNRLLSQVGARDWEYAYSARNYIDLRTVQPIPPPSTKTKTIRKKQH